MNIITFLLCLLSIFSRSFCSVCTQLEYFDLLFNGQICSPNTKYFSVPIIDSDIHSDENGSIATDTTVSTTEAPSSDLASFGEWKQKILSSENASEEVEDISKPVAPVGSTKKPLNFASLDCGARIVGSNGESTNAHALLTESTDEYMNNPCSAPRKYFVVELCDSVSIAEIEVGNLELFSSLPKLFNVSISDRYPSKEWYHVGKFPAKEERQLHMLKMSDGTGLMMPLKYAKFVKIEMLEHYGTEHYCPLTIVRVYGSGLLDDDDADGDADAGDGPDDAHTADKPPTVTLLNVAKKTVMQLFQQLSPQTASNASVTAPANANNVTTIAPSSVSLPSAVNLDISFKSHPALNNCLRCIGRLEDLVGTCPASYLCSYYRVTTTAKIRLPSAVHPAEDDVIVDSKAAIPQEKITVVQENGQESSVKDKKENTTDSVLTQTGLVNDSATSESSANDEKHNGQVVLNNNNNNNNNGDKKAEEIKIPSEAVSLANGEQTDAANNSSKDGTPSNGASPDNDGSSKKKVDALARPSATVEEVIVANIMASVDGMGSDDDGIEIGDKTGRQRMTTNAPSSKPMGQMSRPDRPSIGSSATSKQLLVRFVGRVRELELNLSLTNRYLEQLSLNYRRRLDDLKTRVDLLSNITSAQSLEIERLTNLLNSTSRFYENALLTANQSSLVYIAILCIVLIASFIFSLAVMCSCLYRSLTNRSEVSAPVLANGATNVVLPVTQVNGNGHLPNGNHNGTVFYSKPRRHSPPLCAVNGSKVERDASSQRDVSSAPSTPACAGSLTPSRRISDDDPNGAVVPSAPSTDGSNFPANLPLVVPPNVSKFFLLSPSDKKRHKNSEKNRKRHNHHNGQSGKQSIVPHSNGIK